jgi:CRP-like cAMP-binding protein
MGMGAYDWAVLLTYLQQVPTFGACSQADLEHLLGLAELRAVDAGTTVLREGDIGSEFFLIAQGEVAVERRGKTVAQLGPGGYFGELALFDNAPRNATVETTSSAAFAVLDRRQFATALDDIPALRDSLLVGMARRLHELDARA